jgi:hypothetical protein
MTDKTLHALAVAIDRFCRSPSAPTEQHAANHVAKLIEAYVGGRQTWTRDPPTNPGWYWARRHPLSDPEAVLLLQAGRWIVLNALSDDCRPDDFELWCGPLSPPPLPAE